MMPVNEYDRYFPLGINKATEVVVMLLEHRHPFSVYVRHDSPLRYVEVYSDDAVRDIRALLEVI